MEHICEQFILNVCIYQMPKSYSCVRVLNKDNTIIYNKNDQKRNRT